MFLGVEAQLSINTSGDTTETKLPSRLRETKLRHTAQSEGYETMTQYSSDIVSEVKQTNQFGVPIFVVTRLRNVYSQ